MKPSIFGPRVVADDLGLHRGAAELGRGGEHGVAVDDEDGRELDLAAVVGAEALDLELLALLRPCTACRRCGSLRTWRGKPLESMRGNP